MRRRNEPACRVVSDKKVLCKPSGLISLDFLDTLHPPPKTPGKRGLQAGQLAVPRACGGTLWKENDQVEPAGSIPARAGEPSPKLINPFTTQVYPRACGGTGDELFEVDPDGGLSPRVRGNPAGAIVACGLLARSIPARAGEPCLRDRGFATNCSQGLSPRVRGNPAVLEYCRADRRSIPARAGEPSGHRPRRRRWVG